MKRSYRLQGLECANCAAKIEHAVEKLAGVQSVSLSFMTSKLIIEGDEEKLGDLTAEVEKIVQKYEPHTVVKRA